jgi:hypothetical protein
MSNFHSNIFYANYIVILLAPSSLQNILCQKLFELKKIKISNNIILGAHFSLLTFFENFNFWNTLFSKNVPNVG